jgi:hypothetical protein
VKRFEQPAPARIIAHYPALPRSFYSAFPLTGFWLLAMCSLYYHLVNQANRILMRLQIRNLLDSNLSCLALVVAFNAILVLAFLYLTVTPPPRPPPFVLGTVVTLFLVPIAGYFFVLQRSALLARISKIPRVLVAAMLAVVLTIVLTSIVGGIGGFLYILEH